MQCCSVYKLSHNCALVFVAVWLCLWQHVHPLLCCVLSRIPRDCTTSRGSFRDLRTLNVSGRCSSVVSCSMACFAATKLRFKFNDSMSSRHCLVLFILHCFRCVKCNATWIISQLLMLYWFLTLMLDACILLSSVLQTPQQAMIKTGPLKKLLQCCKKLVRFRWSFRHMHNRANRQEMVILMEM